MDLCKRFVFAFTLGLMLGTVRAQPPAPAPDAPAPESVQLIPGDDVRMEMFGHPEITTEAYVESGGAVHLPLVGSVQVGSMSPGEASKRVEAAYEAGKYFKQPQVTLVVLRSPSRVSVLGEVRNQNRYPIEGNTTVLDALALAGDRTPKGADVIVVLRRDASGKTEHINVDLKSIPSADEKVPAAALVTLRNGDIIYVPPAPQCFVVGEVHKPDGYRLEKGMTVQRAVTLAGGATASGNTDKVEIQRRLPDGDYATLRGKPNDTVQADDVITVKERIF